ncbi:MAG: late competence development ComFB family protein [Cellulosilyticaceae bacterium]
MLEVKNYMEDLVEELLVEVLNQMDMCKCQKCKNDVCAIVLNHLKPLYATSSGGRVFMKFDRLKQQSRADVLAEITQAAKIVAKGTRHE